MLLHRLLNGSRILLSPAHASNTPVVESVWFGSRSAHDSLFITTGEALAWLIGVQTSDSREWCGRLGFLSSGVRWLNWFGRQIGLPFFDLIGQISQRSVREILTCGCDWKYLLQGIPYFLCCIQRSAIILSLFSKSAIILVNYYVFAVSCDLLNESRARYVMSSKRKG